MRSSGPESVHHSRTDAVAAPVEEDPAVVMDLEHQQQKQKQASLVMMNEPSPQQNQKLPPQGRPSRSVDEILYCLETGTEFPESYNEEQEEEDGIRKQPRATEKQKKRKARKKLPHLKRMLVRRGKEYDTAVHSLTSSEDDEHDDHDDGVPPFIGQESQEIDSVTGNWSIEDLPSPNPRNGVAETAATNNNNNTLTLADIAMCRALDLEYERALEDRQVAWTARYQSVRQSTLLSVLFMFLLILTGTAFFLRQADPYWTVPEGLLFTIYTVTTVGYGHLETPSTPTFQLYTIAFILLGIAMLTILVAQVYQCIALEAGRVVMSASATSRNHRNGGMRRWLEARLREQRALQQRQQLQQQQQQQQSQQSSSLPVDSSSMHSHGYYGSNSNNNSHHDMDEIHSPWNWADFVEWFLQNWDHMRTFLKENELGRAISVVLPFAVLIALGAAVIGPLEGWTAVESIYFAVVSLTTVGFGDYYPTRPVSIWFCCFWLPFSVGFMSLYLAHVAAFYIRLSDRNVARIERVLRRRMQRAKERAEEERRAVLRRAYRGQQMSSSHGSNITDEDNEGEWVVAAAAMPEAAETGRGNTSAPEEEKDHSIEDGTMVVTVDHSAEQRDSLRPTAGRTRRGFNPIATLEDESAHLHTPGGDSAAGVIEPTSTASPTKQLFGTHGSLSQRRERILQNSIKHTEFEIWDDGGGKKKQSRISTSMATMKDVLQMVHRNNDSQTMIVSNNSQHRPQKQGDSGGTSFRVSGPESQFLSVHSNQTVLQNDRRTVRKKPSFALRALVQERFAEIIATDIAGYQSSIDIKEYTLAVTIQSLKQTADKWLVPRRARRAFRAVAFEALYFVGEHGLITRGADALFQLTPFEFHQIFSPLLAALGDAETMQAWLEHTQALAEVDLNPNNNNNAGGGNIGALAASAAHVRYAKVAVAAAAVREDEDPPENTTRSRPPAAATQRKRPPPLIPPLQQDEVASEERLPGNGAEQELPPIS